VPKKGGFCSIENYANSIFDILCDIQPWQICLKIFMQQPQFAHKRKKNNPERPGIVKINKGILNKVVLRGSDTAKMFFL
jgi:hypothetical protein